MNVGLLHALPLDSRMWEPQREALARHDVLAPDLYPLGSSMDAWADAVLERVNGALVAVGASMGGYCACALARRAPERLRGLVLAGSRADADSPERRAARADTLTIIRERGAVGLWEQMRPKLFTPDSPAEAVERAQAIALEQDPAGLAAAVEAIRDRPDSTDAIRCPLLVAVGSRDPFVTVEDARALVELDPERRALHIFEGCGHLPSLERPAGFNRVLADFLRSLS